MENRQKYIMSLDNKFPKPHKGAEARFGLA